MLGCFFLIHCRRLLRSNMIKGEGTLELLQAQVCITDAIHCPEGSFRKVLTRSTAGRLKVPSSDIRLGHPLPSFSQANEPLKLEPPE